jgi:hypothetical protein
VLVVVVGRTTSLDDSSHTIRVPEPCACQPHAAPRYLRAILPCCPIRNGGLSGTDLPVAGCARHRALVKVLFIRPSYSGGVTLVLGELFAFPVDYVALQVPHVAADLGVARAGSLGGPLGRVLTGTPYRSASSWRVIHLSSAFSFMAVAFLSVRLYRITQL